MASSIFDQLEESTEQLYYCEPRDKDPRSEEQRQIAFRKLCRDLAPAVLLFAVPNAGKRSQWEQNKAKREGLRAGVCDLICVFDGGRTAWLEFKAGSGAVSPAQHEFLNGLVKRGHHAAVFRNEWTAARWLKRIGAPVIGALM